MTTDTKHALAGDSFLDRFVESRLPASLHKNAQPPTNYRGAHADWEASYQAARRLAIVELRAEYHHQIQLGWRPEELVGDVVLPETHGDGSPQRAPPAEYSQRDVSHARDALVALRRHGALKQFDPIMAACLEDVAGLRYHGPKCRIQDSIDAAMRLVHTLEAQAEGRAVAQGAKPIIEVKFPFKVRQGLEFAEAGRYRVGNDDVRQLLDWWRHISSSRHSQDQQTVAKFGGEPPFVIRNYSPPQAPYAKQEILPSGTVVETPVAKPVGDTLVEEGQRPEPIVEDAPPSGAGRKRAEDDPGSSALLPLGWDK